jgi:hypothetical protein
VIIELVVIDSLSPHISEVSVGFYDRVSMMGSFLKVLNVPKLIDGLSQLFFVKTVPALVKGVKDHGVIIEI